ncbi:pro-cathepsin H-like [Chironomus tepperi]|uniref:pro-cathepsin H-like n=1 Tax=Chironomus tepperi TaxID=113505 RepID=UPI00391F7597
MAITSSIDQSTDDVRSTGFVELPASEVTKRNTTSAKLIRKAKKVKASQYSSNTAEESSVYVNNGPLTGPVKDQGNCGSCWAFCAAAVLQYQAKVYQNRTIEISEQDLMECNDYSDIYGCSGGNPLFPMMYAHKSGVVPMVKYPYRQTKDSCRRSSEMGQSYPIIGDATTANPNGDESVLRTIIDSYGVVATAMGTTSSFSFYSSGVFSDSTCPTKINHCVALVGYGSNEYLGDYWILKNSWGSDWGEAGFFKLERGVNMCGIETANYYLPIP